MELPILLAIAVSLLIIGYLAFTAFRGNSKENGGNEGGARVENDEAEVQGGERGTRRGRLARMGAARRRQTAQEEVEEQVDIEKKEEDEPIKKIGKKKELKMQMKEEKKQMREAEEERRDQRRQKEDKQAEEQKKKETEREEAEKQREQEELLIRREKEKKEEEEYQQWKQMISVEGSGTVLEEQQEKESKIDDFIKYIQERKVVMLEDLAAEFNMKTVETIELIERLDKEGRLSGLVDDRGKFIYVTREEMEKVAKFIHRKGRISIEDIARESNKLINLKPLVSD